MTKLTRAIRRLLRYQSGWAKYPMITRGIYFPPRLAKRYFTLTSGLLAIALTACAPLPSPDVSVRHVPSTDFYNGTRMHLFVFDPREPRSLDARIRLAKAELARDPDCAWAGAPRAVIEDATAKQGAAWKDTLLAAPVTCTA